MKKFVSIVSALLLVIGLSQCRKPALGNFGYKTVTFTTNNGGGEKGSFINAEGIKYQWSSDDKIYVYGSPEKPAEGNTTDFSAGEFCGVLDLVSSDDYYATFKGTKIRLKNEMETFRFVHYGNSVYVNSETGEASVSYTQQYGTLEDLSENVVALCDVQINNECVYENCKLKVQFTIAYFSFVNFFSEKENLTGETFVLSGANSKIEVSKEGEISYSEKTSMTLNDVAGRVAKDGDIGYYLALLPEQKGGSSDNTQVIIRGRGKKAVESLKLTPSLFYCGVNNTPYTIAKKNIVADDYSYGNGQAMSFTPDDWIP